MRSQLTIFITYFPVRSNLILPHLTLFSFTQCCAIRSSLILSRPMLSNFNQSCAVQSRAIWSWNYPLPSYLSNPIQSCAIRSSPVPYVADQSSLMVSNPMVSNPIRSCVIALYTICFRSILFYPSSLSCGCYCYILIDFTIPCFNQIHSARSL
jgi:hypothetical protein